MARKVSRSSTGRRPGDLLDDEDWAGQVRRRRLGETGRHVVTVLAVVVGAALVYLGGTQVPVETATQVAAAPPLVGRTSRVCTMLQPALNQPVLNHPALNQPAPNRPAQGPSGSATSSSQTSVSAVAIRRAPGQAGVLTGAPLGGGTPLLTISE